MEKSKEIGSTTRTKSDVTPKRIRRRRIRKDLELENKKMKMTRREKVSERFT